MHGVRESDARARRGLLAVALSAGVFAAGCGGDTTQGSGRCQAVAGCGGDITGLWHVTSMCAEISAQFVNSIDAGVSLPAACSGLLGSGGEYAPIDATIQFANGQYTEAGTVRSSLQSVVDANCLNALGVTDVAVFCDSLQSSYKHTFDTATCSVSGGTCACSLSRVQAFNQTGGYQTRGSSLVFSGSSVESPYCVTGTTAELSITTSRLTATMHLTR